MEGSRFAATLTKKADRATIVALVGDLGAGKTTFVKGVAKSLGVEEHVTSPTFVIEKIYHLEGQRFEKLIHIDAYRLKGEQHLRALNWHDDATQSENVIFIEWPEHMGGALPADTLRITLTYIDQDTRDISYGS